MLSTVLQSSSNTSRYIIGLIRHFSRLIFLLSNISWRILNNRFLYNSINETSITTRALRQTHALQTGPYFLPNPHHKTNRVEYVLTECFTNLVCYLKVLNTNCTSNLCLLLIRYSNIGSFKRKTLDVLEPVLTLFSLYKIIIIWSPLI